MFTLEQIRTAHAKVRSGADFPAYIRELKELGITHYEFYVTDGHTDYRGNNDFKLVSPAKYSVLIISDNINAEQFKKDLLHHQQGGSDYLRFCQQCAGNGIEMWAVSLQAMTCTYYDKTGAEVLVENILQ
ncbi:MAG: DUF1398 domain-containing protein [Niastella sp.]|nr:DUF1398 domain-containing protein [Niastella sp.]